VSSQRVSVPRVRLELHHGNGNRRRIDTACSRPSSGVPGTKDKVAVFVSVVPASNRCEPHGATAAHERNHAEDDSREQWAPIVSAVASRSSGGSCCGC